MLYYANIFTRFYSLHCGTEKSLWTNIAHDDPLSVWTTDSARPQRICNPLSIVLMEIRLLCLYNMKLNTQAFCVTVIQSNISFLTKKPIKIPHTQPTFSNNTTLHRTCKEADTVGHFCIECWLSCEMPCNKCELPVTPFSWSTTDRIQRDFPLIYLHWKEQKCWLYEAHWLQLH